MHRETIVSGVNLKSESITLVCTTEVLYGFRWWLTFFLAGNEGSGRKCCTVDVSDLRVRQNQPSDGLVSFSFFVSMNFFAFLANSSLSYTFLDMVGLPKKRPYFET